jgi:hypothetical protein
MHEVPRAVTGGRSVPCQTEKGGGKSNHVQNDRQAILAVCSIAMYRTQAIVHLHTLCQVILDGCLFGNFATDTVLKKVCTRYARKSVFLPWKVLRSIDLAIYGGINNTGLDSLQAVEELEKNQYVCLPS